VSSLTPRPAYSKHRREDVLPLRPELAESLRGFVSGLAPVAPVFKLTRRRHSAGTMFQDDLSAAGIDYRDDSDRVADFHCLRHTFISNLAAGGVHPKVAQALARHSTITLTMDRYSHLVHEEQAAALSVLPDLTTPGTETAQAPGTDDPPEDLMSPHLSPKRTIERNSVERSGRNAKFARSVRNAKTPGKQATKGVSPGVSERRGRDSNPRNPKGFTGFRNRPDRPLRHLSTADASAATRATPDTPTLFDRIAGDKGPVECRAAFGLPVPSWRCRPVSPVVPRGAYLGGAG